MRWFQALLPREESFFDQFTAHARLLVQGAEALRELLNGGPGMSEASAAIYRHEEAADEVTRSVFLAIRRTFITPFDRSDIRDLTTALRRRYRPDAEDGQVDRPLRSVDVPAGNARAGRSGDPGRLSDPGGHGIAARHGPQRHAPQRHRPRR